ncbi:MAG: helix-turn-helix domain-containing protein [Proteobacteria bacterium]|nr:helix-turn-helix domain-containing protein [Pseudomonadota bacterium]
MTISPNDQDRASLLRHTEAARYLGVSPGQLRLSRHTGELFKGVSTPAYLKIGHAVRYRKSTLEKWLADLPEFRSTAEYQSTK